jgi:hypothetical protein
MHLVRECCVFRWLLRMIWDATVWLPQWCSVCVQIFHQRVLSACASASIRYFTYTSARQQPSCWRPAGFSGTTTSNNVGAHLRPAARLRNGVRLKINYKQQARARADSAADCANLHPRLCCRPSGNKVNRHQFLQPSAQKAPAAALPGARPTEPQDGIDKPAAQGHHKGTSFAHPLSRWVIRNQ